MQKPTKNAENIAFLFNLCGSQGGLHILHPSHPETDVFGSFKICFLNVYLAFSSEKKMIN